LASSQALVIHHRLTSIPLAYGYAANPDIPENGTVAGHLTIIWLEQA
jgi:hypothetical protein